MNKIERINKLKEVGEILKTEFVGLDDIIDKIIKDKSLINEEIVNKNINDFVTNINTYKSYQLGLIGLIKQLIDTNEDLEDKINNLNKVKLEDIVNIMDKIRLIGYYVIEGEL